MLLAVEGGGFFSSSASGYSKGLALLLLGQRSDEKHMRVAPWNQYQLVDQESDSGLQLASGKNRLSRRCASFICFGRTSTGLDGQSPLKVGPTQPQDITSSAPTNDRGKEVKEQRAIIEHDNIARNFSLRSSLKKSSYSTLQSNENGNEWEASAEEGTDPPELTGRRKVQWIDACGKELVEIKEYELSEAGGSDDEFADANGKTCSCRIL